MHYLDIELKGLDETGKEKTYKLADFKGNNVVLYFYPQDDTPVCTKEAQYFRDEIEKLKKFTTVVGVSENDINEHIEFRNKHNLNFIMLSDVKNELKKAFQKHNKYTPNIHRTTFVLDKDGNIIKYWDKVDVDEHMNEIFDFFNSL